MPIAEEVEEQFVEEGLDGSTVDRYIMEQFPYWRSAEAKKLFYPMPEDNCSSYFSKAYSFTWKSCLEIRYMEACDRDLCTKCDVHNIKIKIYLICKAYQLAI